ncbi:hypothetical protein KAFR_0J02590 [Kazachstania africana CBS 2517]|uniref:Cell division control protein 50 n=1 Tax=Kazachstania africana (strain ATCC 22294 / BCRC 22015 / CBS 2517 / CECT 1963 / NBRC 1671 / NRRL Y-8276) TaxID=1071382 RepID=H2B123_KAZAF|nr:hypothetical protein KAFR_0J02590 [Kazachstania africana CBS 2517]CCF60323.1 hypothetical protein KAFR_0J02590 [Kazachstania africana CBS 2517]
MALFKRFRKSSSGSLAGNGEKKLSNRPPNTAFRQQRLKAWQPILTPQSVLPILIFFACIFTPIGIGILVSGNNVQHITIDYSHCSSLARGSYADIPSTYVGHHFKKATSTKPSWKLSEDTNGTMTCDLKFEIPNEIKDSVYVYYKLTNFYQNHRKYMESFDLKQLRGKAPKLEEVTTDCKPLRSIDDKVIYPCGLIANSMFNDTFDKTLVGADDDTSDFVLTNKKISWSIDRHRFKKTTYPVSDIIPPPNWAKQFPEGYTEDNLPDLHTWEEFQVWMRPSPFPKFYKLALKNETTHLPKGNYVMSIGLNYPISYFGGSKSFVLTTNGVAGTQNLPLGVFYLIVAGLCALFSILFLVKVVFQPRALGDNTYLNFESGDRNAGIDQEMYEGTEQLREIL